MCDTCWLDAGYCVSVCATAFAWPNILRSTCAEVSCPCLTFPRHQLSFTYEWHGIDYMRKVSLPSYGVLAVLYTVMAPALTLDLRCMPTVVEGKLYAAEM